MREDELDAAWKAILQEPLLRICEQEGKEALAKMPGGLPSPDCPAVPMFLPERRGRDWNTDEEQHMASCLYCQRMLRLVAKREAEQKGDCA